MALAVGVSAARRHPALLHEAIREAMLLAELACAPEAALAGQEETYRLLIGVLLRDPGEVELLRASTISPLLAYDAEHDTELLVTLATFLGAPRLDHRDRGGDEPAPPHGRLSPEPRPGGLGPLAVRVRRP